MLLRISHLGLLLCILLINAANTQIAASEGYEKYEDALECSFCLDNEDYNRCLELEEAEWKKNQEECNKHKTDCKKLCDDQKLEIENIINDVSKELEQKTKKTIWDLSSEDFQEIELTSVANKAIIKCTRLNGVEKYWGLRDANSAKAQGLVETETCNQDNIELDGSAAVECTPYWFSRRLRATFYQQCLLNWNIEGLFQTSRLTVQELEELSFNLRNSEDAATTQKIAGSVSLIAGGTLGLILAPFTGGTSLVLTALAGGITTAGSITTMLAGDNQIYIREAETRFNELSADMDELNFLLRSFAESSYNADKYKRRKQARLLQYTEQLRNKIKSAVEKKAFNAALGSTLLSGSSQVVAAIPFQSLLGKLQNSKLSLSKLSSLKVPKVSLGALIKNSNSLQKVSGVAGRARSFIVNSKIWTTFQQATKVIAPLLSIGIGIWGVVAGTEEYKTGFSHSLRAAAKQISYNVDGLIAVYETIAEREVKMDKSQQETEFLYVLDVAVKKSSIYSKFMLELFNEGTKEKCVTNEIYAKDTINRVIGDLGAGAPAGPGCRRFPILKNGKTKVRVISSKGYEVSVETVYLTTNGRFTPSLVCDDDGREIIANKRRPSQRHGKCTSKSSVYKIKTHTSNRLGSGTDHNVRMTLKVFENEKDEKPKKECQTNWLDNAGNDRERGDTDIYGGEDLGECADDFTEIVEGAYENKRIEIDVELARTNGIIYEDAWRIDLLKIYLVGNPSETNILSCKLYENGKAGVGEGYDVNIKSSGPRQTFDCIMMKGSNTTMLEQLEVHTCDITLAGTGSDTMKFKFCDQKDLINKTKNLDGHCCTTNRMAANLVRNKWSLIDGDNFSKGDDGGEKLGECEGFDFSKMTDVWIGVDNPSTNAGCIDQMRFYGTGNSTWGIPFGSCNFHRVWSDSHLIQIYHDPYGKNYTEWAGWREEPVKCSLNKKRTVKTISVQVCDKNKGTDPGSKRKIQAVIKNGNGQSCTTSPMGPFYPGNFVDFKSLGSECSKMEIGQEVEMNIVNVDDDDGLCLSKIFFDASDENGSKQYQCRFDEGKDFNVYFQNKLINNTLPLICK